MHLALAMAHAPVHHGALWHAFPTLRDLKDELKVWFAGHGLSAEWRVLRDIIFNPMFYLRLVVPFFVLERFFAVSRRKQWFTTNIRLDYIYPILNALFFGAIAAGAVTAMKAFFDSRLPFLNTGLLDGKPIVVQAIGAFLITDFTFFFSHYVRHKVKWFWYFHAIHHSQEDMNPLTSHRGHPLETIISNAIRIAPIAFVGGTYPMWFWFTILNDSWGYVIHSNSRVNLGPFKKIIVSPQYHRVHHSRDQRHYDKNFGERLVLWDTLFGTRYDNYDEYPVTGVDDFPTETNVHGVGALFFAWARQVWYPFQMIGRSMGGWLSSRVRLLRESRSR